jgi:hypothetical protein
MGIIQVYQDFDFSTHSSYTYDKREIFGIIITINFSMSKKTQLMSK